MNRPVTKEIRSAGLFAVRKPRAERNARIGSYRSDVRRVPRLLNKLSDNASSLLMLSRKFATSRHLIMAELSKIEANIDSVKEKDEKAEGAVARFQIVIKIYRDDPGNRDKLWEVYSHLQGLIEKIKNIQQDRLEER